jgi:UDP-N-acetylmuramoyl-L-alanyl-D-glutamate--2,6-diaminopimelate ligase
VVVDYAHTPDALRRTLATARALCEGTLTVVFGAGGERDQAKRPMMGEAASAADRIVLTSDNPRSEDPRDIAGQIASGVQGVEVAIELDRELAIRGAIAAATATDVVLIAGKGHERTQTVDGRERTFSDVDIARAAVDGSC